MIALSRELDKAINLYNEKRKPEQRIDWYEVIDEINDLTDEKEVQEAINEILMNI